MKQPHKVKLFGFNEANTMCKPHMANEVSYFATNDGSMVVIPEGLTCKLTTPKGEYKLDKSWDNQYTGSPNRVRVQVNLKKIVAHLIYWS